MCPGNQMHSEHLSSYSPQVVPIQVENKFLFLFLGGREGGGDGGGGGFPI